MVQPSGKLESVACDLCGARDDVEIARGPDRYHGGAEVFTAVRCRNCGLAYTNPRPSAPELGRYYPENYLPYQPAHSALMRLAKWIFLRLQIRRLRALVPAGGKILEVGCAAGEELAGLRDRGGFRVWGIEMSPTASARAREAQRLDVWTGGLPDAPWPERSFDLVKMKYVLEHVPSPGRDLARTHALLQPGGHLLIWVPNIASPLFRIFKSRWQGMDLPRHLYHFENDTVSKYCEKFGFQMVRKSGSPVPNGLIVSLRFLLEEKLRRPLPWLTWTHPIWFFLFLPFSALLALLGLSDRTVYLLRKPA